MRKPGTVGHFSAAAAACEKAGIRVDAFTIIGLPYSDVRKDVGAQLFCLTQPIRRGLPILYYPIPTTPQYDHCVRKGWVRPEARFLPRLRSEAFVASRPGYSRREAFTLLNLAELFGDFKLAARAFVPDGRKASIQDVLTRHGRENPFRLREAAPGEFRLEGRGRPIEARDILFAQIGLLANRGMMTAAVTTTEVRLRAVGPSKTVLRLFLNGLPKHPLRYVSGEEVSW
jgi:hypothetical protein